MSSLSLISLFSHALPPLLHTNPSSNFRFVPLIKRKISTITTKMDQNRGDGEGNRSENTLKSNPKVDKMQSLVNEDSIGGWDKCWEQGLTPWDLGGPTPVLLQLLQTGNLPKGRVLVPGCGSGHDVIAIASPERYVVGLEFSKTAMKIARELSSSSPNANCFELIEADFFTWHPTELFDLIFDYTFFCAIEPSMRSSWGSRIQKLLKPDGELITLMFPVSDHSGGPPYKVSVTDYEEVLHPMGFKAISIIDNELAIEPRKGKEKLGRWKRSLKRSEL